MSNPVFMGTVIRADDEYLAAQRLADAARIIRKEPPALQLRYLQTLVEIAGEGNSTIIPIPMDALDGLRGALSRPTAWEEEPYAVRAGR